ncbi:MAG: hypothetical protein IKE65_00095 [Clostridia bacterium]|nr:hypothetical protein [Clostridia bacterium]
MRFAFLVMSAKKEHQNNDEKPRRFGAKADYRYLRKKAEKRPGVNL